MTLKVGRVEQGKPRRKQRTLECYFEAQPVRWVFEQNIVRCPSQNCKLHQLSKHFKVIPDLRRNQAWLLIRNELGLASTP